MKKSTKAKLKTFFVLILLLVAVVAAGAGWFYMKHLEEVRQEQQRVENEKFVKDYKEVFDLVRERNEREIALRREYDLKALKKMEEIFGKPVPRKESAPDVPLTGLDLISSRLYRDLDLLNEAERHLQGVEKEHPYDMDILIVGGAVSEDPKARRRRPAPTGTVQSKPSAAN